MMVNWELFSFWLWRHHGDYMTWPAKQLVAIPELNE
jgi:hypothetical protein